jgi:hypothetical protein
LEEEGERAFVDIPSLIGERLLSVKVSTSLFSELDRLTEAIVPPVSLMFSELDRSAEVIVPLVFMSSGEILPSILITGTCGFSSSTASKNSSSELEAISKPKT